MNGLVPEYPALNSATRQHYTIVIRTLFVAAAAGALFAAVDSPLPWLIGPLLVTAVLRLAGVRLDCPVAWRASGQWVIGAALGLYFTPAVLSQLSSLWWAILVAAGFSWLLTLAFGWLLRRHGELDAPTAFFAGAIGSATEMAIQGERHGGRFELIAAVHSVRVVIVVVGVPYVYRLLDLHGSDPYQVSRADVYWPGLALLIVTSLVVAMVFRRLRWPNSWMLAPLTVAGLATALDFSPTALPREMIIAGQLFIGMALGVRFSPDSMAHIRRIVPLVAVATVVGIMVAAGFGVALAALIGLPGATLVLATSPGGIAEMSLTAKVLQLGVPVVTAFQVTRMIVMVLTVGVVYRWLARRWPQRWADGDVGD